MTVYAENLHGVTGQPVCEPYEIPLDTKIPLVDEATDRVCTHTASDIDASWPWDGVVRIRVKPDHPIWRHGEWLFRFYADPRKSTEV